MATRIKKRRPVVARGKTPVIPVVEKTETKTLEFDAYGVSLNMAANTIVCRSVAGDVLRIKFDPHARAGIQRAAQ